ncbi:zinc finger, C2H2 type [Necator americanus]|uniref:Zinc finger, C2H2 type n=1 Tax=Necator americanus TaxID=51031 RepID=W2T0J3_NECAM|nr:zinc finger, C2H2 type [Necator americanus]ETN75525.1 zinc finger, C2H2 type [Necator americanus]
MDLTEEEVDEAYGEEIHDETEHLLFAERSGDFASHQAFKQFKSKNRQYGNAVCPECKQSFVNSARLERHLAVHQNMDVQSLRLLVEEVVVKRKETEPVDIGISSKALFQGGSSVDLEMPIDPQSPLARACMICGILVHRNHLPQHEALHGSTTESGLKLLDMQSPSGGYYCDLCGVAFRRKENLYSHWRSSCPEIMANIEPGSELFLSDVELKTMVLNLLMRLRRMFRQSPLRPIRTNRGSFAEDHSLHSPSLAEEARNFNNRIPTDMKERGSSTLNGSENTLVFMDDYVSPVDTVVNIDGELVNVVSADRGKWNISEDGKPLECPDCFRQFANAGRLERHISGFHSHYGAFKCLLCGHRFKYDYNLLFHYRHSCAYTKLLVGADVRKLLDAASLRKLVAQIKQRDPELRPGSSRLVNIKRRPSIKAIPRNILPLGKNSEKAKSKRGLEEGKKCPVCAPVLTHDTSDDGPTVTLSSSLEKDSTLDMRRKNAAQLDSYEVRNSTEDVDAPPVLEMQTPGEVVPTPTRCIDVNGDEITDFDADQLSEMDIMLYSGELALGDLEEVEYRVAVGTRHGRQIVLERTNKSPKSVAVKAQEETTRKESHDRQHTNEIPSRRTTIKEDKNIGNEQNFSYQNDDNRGEYINFIEEDELRECVNEENNEVDYQDSHLVEYEIDGTVEEGERQLVRIVDNRGQQMHHYLNNGYMPCGGFAQYVEDDNGQKIVEFVKGDDGEQVVHYFNANNMTEEEVIMYLKSQFSSISNLKDEVGSYQAKGSSKDTGRYPTLNGSSSASNSMPEDFMQEE